MLRYICGTKDDGFKYSSSTNLSPIRYSDSDWGGCKINRKSTSGIVFIMAGAAISWKSKMGRGKVVERLLIASDRSEIRICEECVMGKMHRTPIPRECRNRAAGLLDLIHTDVAGPLPVMSKGGARYFATFIDDKSRWVTVYPIKSKSDCFSYFRLFLNRMETETGRKTKSYTIRWMR